MAKRGRPELHNDNDLMQLAQAIQTGAGIGRRAATRVAMWVMQEDPRRDGTAEDRIRHKLADKGAPPLPSGWRLFLRRLFQGDMNATLKTTANIRMTVTRADGTKEEIPPQE